MERSRSYWSRILWLAIALAAGLVVVGVTVGAARASSAGQVSPSTAPGGVEGYLYEPGSTTPVSAGWISIHNVEGEPLMGTDTDPSGYFRIANLPPNEYILHAYPPPASPYAASLPQVVEVLSGQWANTALYLTEVRVSGYVRDCDAIPEERIAGAAVIVHSDDWSVIRWAETDVNGEFKIGGLAVGVPYILEAFPPEGTPYVPLEPFVVTPTVTGLVLELCIPPPSIVGTVHDPIGDPVPGAGVIVYQDDFWRETHADELGDFVFRGLPDVEFWVQAAPPWGPAGEGLTASEPFTVTVPPPPGFVDVGVITLPPAFKRAIGHVLNSETGAGVPDAVVAAHRLDEPGYADTPTDPTGQFTLTLPGGEWHLYVEPHPPPHPPAQWVFPGPPAWVVFELPDDVPEVKGAVLEVFPTNAWVTGRVLCPPSVVACPSHEAIGVELRRDEIGNGAGLAPDYRFEIPIPDGWYELIVHVEDPLWQGPPPMPVFVEPGPPVDVGDVELLLKDARIEGRVRNELGAGVPGVPVVAWQPEGFGWGWAETDASGAYEMPVIGGEWFVEPQPPPDMPLVFHHRPRLARVAPGGTLAGVNFELTVAESRIEGMAVDAADPAAGRLWGLDGWASAHLLPGDEFFSDAPLRDGGFGLKVKGGRSYGVALDLPPHAPFVSGGAAPVAVPPASQVPISVPLEHKNSAIEGALVIAGTSPPEPAHGVWAEVFGEDKGGHWTVAGVDPDSAGYELGVISGTWRIRAWVDPESGYVAPPTPTLVTVGSHQVVGPIDLPVWPIASTISGQVQKPDGTPLPGAFVYAEGESPHIGYFETHAESDAQGLYELSVLEGGYVVGAALPGDELEARGWLNPRPLDVPWVSTGSPVTGQDLRFRVLDGQIQGSVTFASGLDVTATHPAYVWAWADTGEWAETEAAAVTRDTFTYTLPVVKGTVWHVGAVYEDPDNGVYYESSEEDVDLRGVAQATQDLELDGPKTLPQPVIVTFDGTYMQTIQLLTSPGRYLELRIPAGALVDSGTVTLFIFPTQELRPEPGQEIVGAGYEMWAVDQNGQEITQFRQNVQMVFPYPSDADLAKAGISEHLLVPVYYSTLVGRWILAESYVLDTEQNEITLRIGHFTKFAALSKEEKGYGIYLPTVLRSGS